MNDAAASASRQNGSISLHAEHADLAGHVGRLRPLICIEG